MQKNKVMNLVIHNTLGVQVYPLNVNDLSPRMRFTSDGGKSVRYLELPPLYL